MATPLDRKAAPFGICTGPRLFFSLALACLTVLGVPSSARAEDEARVTQHVDLSMLHTSVAPTGPNLAAPSDLFQRDGYEGTGSWNVDWAQESGTWMPFSRAYLEDRGVSIDTIIELVQMAMPRAIREMGELSIEPEGDGLRVSGPAAHVEEALQAVAWVLESAAPRRRIETELWSSEGSGVAERLRAMGGERLWPGRWTRVYLEKEEVPCTPMWAIEVAEGVTIMDPHVIPLVEGSELYVRYHPGESVDLVEVWAGCLTHREQIRTDLSGLRNVPEAVGAGAATYMRTDIARAFTTLVLPRSKDAVRELRWETTEGRSLRLVIRAPANSPSRPRPTGPTTQIEIYRIGAAAAALEFEGRTESGDWIADRATEFEAGDAAQTLTANVLESGELLLLEGVASPRAGVRGLLTTRETALQARQVALRVLEVDEPSWRSLLTGGRAGLGKPVAPADLAALRDAGAVTRAFTQTPVLLGTPGVGLRLGTSEPGLQDVDCEIAGRSAGLHPITTAAFAGWNGTLSARALSGRLAVRLNGIWSWADANAGHLELMLRDPNMGAYAPEGRRSEAQPDRKAVLSVLGGGSSTVQRDLDLPLAGGQEVLAHVIVRGRQVLLLLVSVEPAPRSD